MNGKVKWEYIYHILKCKTLRSASLLPKGFLVHFDPHKPNEFAKGGDRKSLASKDVRSKCYNSHLLDMHWFVLPLMHHHFLLMDIPFVHCVITSMISCTPFLDLMMMKFITGLSQLYNQVVSVSYFAILLASQKNENIAVVYFWLVFNFIVFGLHIKGM